MTFEKFKYFANWLFEAVMSGLITLYAAILYIVVVMVAQHFLGFCGFAACVLACGHWLNKR